jgi:hypothetical protein
MLARPTRPASIKAAGGLGLERGKSMGLLLLIIVVLLLFGAVPAWPHSRTWGYYPSGIIGLLFVILLIMLLFRAIPWGW